MMNNELYHNVTSTRQLPFNDLYSLIRFMLADSGNSGDSDDSSDDEYITEASQYINDIIQTFNKIRSDHINLFKNAIKFTRDSYKDRSFKNIEIDDVPFTSEYDLMAFMSSLKIMIVKMKKIEYELVKTVNNYARNARNANNAIADHYHNLLKGKIELVPCIKYSLDNPIIKKLNDMFRDYRE